MPKKNPYQLLPLTSTNVGIIGPKFFNFSFNAISRLVKNLKAIPSASPKLLNLNQDIPQKN